MDFSLLKSFTAVADEKSFSTAAKHLFISQQSLSKQIAKLEEELGTTLFVRSRPLSLTPDGKQFLQTAKEILQLKQQYEESSSHSFSGSHFIHVGIEHTIARAILPYVLPEYLKEHPDTYVKVSEESPEVLHKSIIYDGVDLVIGSINASTLSKKSPPKSVYPVTFSPARTRYNLRDCNVYSSERLSGAAISVRSAPRGVSSSQTGFSVSHKLQPVGFKRIRLYIRVSKRLFPRTVISPSLPSHPAPGDGRFFPFGFADVSS